MSWQVQEKEKETGMTVQTSILAVFSVLLAGAGIKGGQVYGSSDATGAEPKDNPTSIEDLVATIYDRLGMDPKKEYQAPNGRPIRLSNNGTPIRSPLV